MKIRSLVATLAICLAALAGAFGISNPQTLTYSVNNYQNWRGYVINGNSATGSQTILVQLTGLQLPSQSGPYNPLGGAASEAFVPILVDQDGVTPTGVSCGIPAPTGVNVPGNGFLCNVTANFGAIHGNGSVISTNDAGVQEAINDAFLHGGGVVVVDGTSGATAANISAATPYPSVTIENRTGGGPAFWIPGPTTLSVLATPVPRIATVSCGGTTTVCDGTAVGTWTNASQFVCVTYVNALGEESPCSTTAHYTSAGSLAINFTAPVASTGAVGWRAYIGLAYLTTAYQIPITSANCTLTTIETVLPACAVTNATYNQVGSSGVFPTPNVHTQLVPQAGGVAAAYNPNPISHNAAGYLPSTHGYPGFVAHEGPFTTTVALTAGQLGVLGTISLPASYLNYIGETIQVHGKFSYTPTTGGTVPTLAVKVGDITDFTTGTPITECNMPEVHTTTTATYLADFTCNLQTNAIGTTGSLLPSGFIIDNVSGTLGIAAADVNSAVVTTDVLDQDQLFIVFLQTSSAETTGPTLLTLDVNTL